MRHHLQLLKRHLNTNNLITYRVNGKPTQMRVQVKQQFKITNSMAVERTTTTTTTTTSKDGQQPFAITLIVYRTNRRFLRHKRYGVRQDQLQWSRYPGYESPSQEDFDDAESDDVEDETFDQHATMNGSSSTDMTVCQSSHSGKTLYPAEIKSYLDKHVIGQENAKTTLSLAVYEHYLRVKYNEKLRRKDVISNSSQRPLVERSLFYNINQIRIKKEIKDELENKLKSLERKQPFRRTPGSGADVPDQVPVANRLRSHSTNIPPVQQDTTTYNFGTHNLNNIINNIRLEKSNIILLGPSGVGKTFITQKLAELLEVPVALCDCTTMTQAGYVGDDVETVLQRLLQNANGDLQRAQRGIVFLDEMDKIASTRESSSHAYRDVSGEGVQHAMLKMVEGTVVNVKNGKRGQQDTVPMDTTDILFIASGAFTGLDRVVSRRLDKRTMGFGAPTLDNSITTDDKEQQVINEKRDKLLNRVDQGDLIKFGMIPELVGRFPRIVPFHSLCKQSLVRVLTEPSNALLKQEQKYFELHDARLEFTDDALEEIAQMAMESKTGARALKSILGNVLVKLKYTLPGSDIDTAVITKECVRGQAIYELTKRKMAATKTGKTSPSY